jgi:hypothetical protein
MISGEVLDLLPPQHEMAVLSRPAVQGSLLKFLLAPFPDHFDTRRLKLRHQSWLYWWLCGPGIFCQHLFVRAFARQYKFHLIRALQKRRYPWWPARSQEEMS